MKSNDKIYIKFGKVKINIFSIASLLILYINETPESLIIILSAIITHEMGHYLAIKCFDVDLKYFVFEPFGCSIIIDDHISYKKDIIVSIFGPIMNTIVASITTIIFKFHPSFYLLYFIILNFSYSIINVIPCAELDGGKIVDAFLKLHYDYCKAIKITLLVDRISSVIIVSILILLCINSNLNFSLTTFCIFIIIIFPHKNE